MQAAKSRFESQSIKVAALSYDTEAILKDFAQRRYIEIPLIADPDSKIIRAYDLLNPEAVGEYKGMARPGYFFIDSKGVIREKFFEAKYRTRNSGNNVILRYSRNLAKRLPVRLKRRIFSSRLSNPTAPLFPEAVSL